MVIENIKDKNEILATKTYNLGDLGWANEIIPKTSVNIGFLEDFGLYFYFKVEEKNPIKIYKNHLDPVYQDSAVEAFFTIWPKGPLYKYRNKQRRSLFRGNR